MARSRVIEQPHKVPYLAKLVGLLYTPAEGAADSSEADPLGYQILQHCWKCCKETTEDNDLRHIRQWVCVSDPHMKILNAVLDPILLAHDSFWDCRN
jgi:hypothetical protein